MIKRILLKILYYLALRLADTEEKQQYPQLWWYSSRLKKKHKRLVIWWQWLCEKLVGHELSATERGYGGGRYIDCWCRWCNKLIQVPIEESIWAEKYWDLIQEVGKEK